MKTIKTIFEVGDTVRITKVILVDESPQQGEFVAKACVQTVNPEGDRIKILITRTVSGYFCQNESPILRTFQGGDIWKTPTLGPAGAEHYSHRAPGFYLEITDP